MDEEAATRAAFSGNGWQEHGAQASQGPLMTFFARAIDLETKLVTLKEILCEFERIMRGELDDAERIHQDNAQRISPVCRRLLDGWRAVRAWGGRWLGKDGCRAERCAGEDGNRISWAAKEAELRGMVTELQEETQRALDGLYAGIGLPARYRTLPALVSIYEYFLSGQCNTLLGGAGAYSVFEAEVRAGTMAEQADEAWARREAIGRKHPVLCRRLAQIHETARRMAQEAAWADSTQELAWLPAWNAFARGVHQVKND